MIRNSTVLLATLTLAGAGHGAETIDLSTPEAAARAHLAVFADRDDAAYEATSHFPVVQFYPGREPVVYASAADLEDLSEYPLTPTPAAIEVVEHVGDLALVRVRMRIEGPEGTFGGAAWWGLREDEGEWRISWRQWLGPVPLDAAD